MDELSRHNEDMEEQNSVMERRANLLQVHVAMLLPSLRSIEKMMAICALHHHKGGRCSSLACRNHNGIYG